ncbi:MAG: hypothetical protein ACI8PQ_000149 [Planctomycetota bacterium]|jgi:uncharacterized protein involved in exopolysaccharide biosynthesis
MADVGSSGQLQEFLRVLRRRRWQIVMPAIFVLALGTVFAVLVPKQYVITTQVELLEGLLPEVDPNARDRIGSAVQREVQNIASHLTSYIRIKTVVEEQASLWPEYTIADAEGRRDWIERIQGNMRVAQIEKRRNEGSTFVDIEYRDVDGQRAVNFLEDLINKWVREVVQAESTRLQAGRDNFQDAYDETLLAKRKAMQEYNALAREIGINPMQSLGRGPADSQADPIYERVAYEEQQLLDVQADIATAEEVLLVASELLEAADEYIPADIEGNLFDLREGAELLIADLELERNNMLPTNTDWKRIDRQIEDIQTRLAAEEIRITQERPQVPNEALPDLKQSEDNARAISRGLRAREVRLQDSIDDLKNERSQAISSMAELFDLSEILEERTIANRQTWEDLNAKERALVQLEAFPVPYQITRDPEVAGSPKEPNTVMLVILSAFVGLALGLSIAMAAEYARNSYRTVSEVAQVMAIPVLGTVDQIVTTIESRRQQARRALVGLSSAVILGGLAWFTWIWAVFPNKLPVQVTAVIEKFRTLLM